MPEITYACGCKACGPVLPLPRYCAEHGKPERRYDYDPVAGIRCVGIWLDSVGFKSQAEDLAAYAADEKALRDAVEAICQERATSPITRARLRHALAGVDWRKAK